MIQILIQMLIKAGKFNPADVMNQQTVADLLHILGVK